jgi:hypothetical protein
MFSTTLRIDDDLGRYLAEVAKSQALSVNAFLAQLLERERREAHRRRLAKDWAVYGQEGEDVDYALAAQLEAVAEKSRAYVTKKPVTGMPVAKKATRKPAKTQRKS